MNSLDKEKLLEEAQASVESVVPVMREDFKQSEKELIQTKEELRYRLDSMSQLTLRAMASHLSKRVNELKHLQGSPYFFRCDVKLREENKTIYFSKYTYPEKNIYSWVSPASVMRFEQCGPVKYEVPDIGIREGTLERKDQFLIVDGKIRFMATESMGLERELVYQEYLSQRKNSFILPEIVEQMERAQDAVIRAHHKGSFLIAGPAGSGKTTLALHRVAYLAQSPDTAQLFPSEGIIVFVQDNRTKEYFSSLLPQLGIEGVKIITFADWAFER
jgi:DNA helicase II / ATP-dependent DNA helicase PcrA